MYEERVELLNQQLEDEHAHVGEIEVELKSTKKRLKEYQNSSQVKYTCITLKQIIHRMYCCKFSYTLIFFHQITYVNNYNLLSRHLMDSLTGCFVFIYIVKSINDFTISFLIFSILLVDTYSMSGRN